MYAASYIKIKTFAHSNNPDKQKYSNGKFIIEFIIEGLSAITINHLKYKNINFDGTHTFYTGDQRSQIEWCIA